jgi:hypothetical protein
MYRASEAASSRGGRTRLRALSSRDLVRTSSRRPLAISRSAADDPTTRFRDRAVYCANTTRSGAQARFALAAKPSDGRSTTGVFFAPLPQPHSVTTAQPTASAHALLILKAYGEKPSCGTPATLAQAKAYPAGTAERYRQLHDCSFSCPRAAVPRDPVDTVSDGPRGDSRTTSRRLIRGLRRFRTGVSSLLVGSRGVNPVPRRCRPRATGGLSALTSPRC